jgi:hypothetical protein
MTYVLPDEAELLTKKGFVQSGKTKWGADIWVRGERWHAYLIEDLPRWALLDKVSGCLVNSKPTLKAMFRSLPVKTHLEKTP